MKVTLLGIGPPINPNRFQSSAPIEIGSDLLLFDAGGGALHQLLVSGVDLSGLGPIFITHHHYDYINDMYPVILSTATLGRVDTLHIYGPGGIQYIVDSLLNGVYGPDIRFRIEENREVPRRTQGGHQRSEAINYVAVDEIGSGVVAVGDGWRVIADYVRHGDFPDSTHFDWRCPGYRIESQSEVITISGDTVPCPGVTGLDRDAGLFAQCYMWPESVLTNPTVQLLIGPANHHSGWPDRSRSRSEAPGANPLKRVHQRGRGIGVCAPSLSR